MKKIFLLFWIALATTCSFAQQQDVNQLQETAKSFMRQGDFSNAILVLNRAIEQQPNNIELSKSLALSYFYKKDNAKAIEIIKPLLDREDADDQTYQIGGTIYKAMDQVKEAVKMYKKGIKKFPESGAMYNEYGELLWSQQDYSAIKQWEKGIESDPNYSGNYYNACKFYYLTTDKVWSIIYAETFLNLETFTGRTAEIKDILLESYKKLFLDQDLLKSVKEKNPFAQAFLQTMNKEAGVASEGINPESLTMIRTRFILDWYEANGTKFPFKLFDLHRQLLQEGLFEAYNQWLFGTAQNLVAYQNWTSIHSSEYNDFSKFQKGRIFKIPTGQYYQTK